MNDIEKMLVGTFLALLALLGMLIIIQVASNSYEKEITVQVVAVEKITSDVWWPHTSIRYTDIQKNAVTELTIRYASFAGTHHDLEPGKTYYIKYHMQWNWYYPVIDEIKEVSQ